MGEIPFRAPRSELPRRHWPNPVRAVRGILSGGDYVRGNFLRFTSIQRIQLKFTCIFCSVKDYKYYPLFSHEPVAINVYWPATTTARATLRVWADILVSSSVTAMTISLETFWTMKVTFYTNYSQNDQPLIITCDLDFMTARCVSELIIKTFK